MIEAHRTLVASAQVAAVEVLRHNMLRALEARTVGVGAPARPEGSSRERLPRAAGWGYPEPYTRDLMISTLGILASGDGELIAVLRTVLERAARAQTPHGHIPSLIDDPLDRGASDTTPLFLLAVALYRRASGERSFLAEAAERALTWLRYRSPDDAGLVSQLPTSDWRDEQWVLGYGLYVNTLCYGALRLHGRREEAERLGRLANLPVIQGEAQKRHVHEGLALVGRPYYALWSYKIYSSDRFDLVGNALAVLVGLADATRARRIVRWVEDQCRRMRDAGDLTVGLPPVLFPYIRPGDEDWRPRYERYNRPGEYHNGGIWPMACGFYVAAALAAGLPKIAERSLVALSELNLRAANPDRIAHEVRARGGVARAAGAAAQGRRSAIGTTKEGAADGWGFNEWIGAQDGAPRGQDWQTWSAAMYLYAAACVEQGRALYFRE